MVFLGPLLFIIYSADVAQAIKQSKFHIYNKLNISEVSEKISDALHLLNEGLNAIAEWSIRNALVLNPNESKFI